ncbi:MAG: hypothetical protein GPJ54_21860 [Candidatus Heimdallarchaeota archaeon]|nr:hypothetical protein [Candidatus Heimdallarchaeota archaeon]
MMSKTRKIKKFFRIFMREDLKVVGIFLLFITSIFFGYTVFMGWMSPYGLSFNTPSVDSIWNGRYVDSDRDLLPDIIEQANPGVPVLHTDGRIIGYGTGTNYLDMDSDNDGFTDGAEDNFGSNPTTWLDPGFIWIIWISSLVIALALRRRSEDRLKEYKEFEQLSSGVSGKEGKFAFGSTSIFSQDYENMSAEEKTKKIQQDGRYQRMMGLVEPEDPKISKNRTKTIVQFAVVAVAVIFIRFILSQ